MVKLIWKGLKLMVVNNLTDEMCQKCQQGAYREKEQIKSAIIVGVIPADRSKDTLHEKKKFVFFLTHVAL